MMLFYNKSISKSKAQSIKGYPGSKTKSNVMVMAKSTGYN